MEKSPSVHRPLNMKFSDFILERTLFENMLEPCEMLRRLALIDTMAYMTTVHDQSFSPSYLRPSLYVTAEWAGSAWNGNFHRGQESNRVLERSSPAC